METAGPGRDRNGGAVGVERVRGGRFSNLDDWIAARSTPFPLDREASIDAAADRMIAVTGKRASLLGLGEALHGGEALLVLRNRLFFRLARVHGFSAIAVESDYLRGRIVDDYVTGRSSASLDEVCETGFSHGFGRLEANRELVALIREYNRDPNHRVPLRFYGFDSPTEMTHTKSPLPLILHALDHLDSLDQADGDHSMRARLIDLVGDDARWENPAAMTDRPVTIGGALPRDDDAPGRDRRSGDGARAPASRLYHGG